MPEKHLRFHSTNGKRRLLIVSDRTGQVQPRIDFLLERYELLFAPGNEEAIAAIIRHRDTLSLVILDIDRYHSISMEILKKMKEDPGLSGLPLIIMSENKDKEADWLFMGAMDFIPKPYPSKRVILARIQRAIELSEDREIISLTERDPMTGLFSREYFYRYAVQFDAYHKSMAMDAIVVDVNHFRMINERFGRNIGDEINRQIGANLRGSVAEDGGIVCRRNGDTFLIYCPHRDDYAEILEKAAVIPAHKDINVRLRMGVYPNVDKSLEIERRFDHAKMASDTRRGNYYNRIGFYDKELHDAEIRSEHLLEGFEEAIRQEQFKVYYQPKFDIRRGEPVLNSAEALVRWVHHELGMIRPDQFIPLFEENGLITQMDTYVWRRVARQMAVWKEKYGKLIPVSVNVSRIDMYDPDFVSGITALVREYGISPEEFLLEITESAYTQDSDQIIENVKNLRNAGFLIEMDDFGSGYSSLNMISTLPIDVVKLDMQFIRSAFKTQKDTRMLEAVIGIADSLNVPTIAEGVETEAQLNALRAMGCDIGQGYFFSKPVPPEDYEHFIEVRMEIEEEEEPVELSHRAPHLSLQDYSYDYLRDSLTGLYNANAFRMLVKDADKYHTALLVIEVAEAEHILERKGQLAAEIVVKHVGDVLRQSFRSVDHICRIDSTRFGIIMSRVDSSLRIQLKRKIDSINEVLRHPEADIPGVTLSVGVAFADRKNPEGSILEDAETALARLKDSGEDGCEMY